MAKGITAAQKTKIWTKASEIGMTEEQLRDLVKWVSGQKSTRELTKQEGILLIDVLEGKTPCPPPISPFGVGQGEVFQRMRTLRPRKDKKKIGQFLPPASHRQIALIGELKIEAGYDDEHLKNHIRKYCKVESVFELDSKQAWRVFEMLKKQKQKRMNEATHVLS